MRKKMLLYLNIMYEVQTSNSTEEVEIEINMAGATLHLIQAPIICCVQEKKNTKKQNYRVLVLGGTGRVGGSTATALSKFSPDLRLVIGGRNKEKGCALVATLGKNSEFLEVDIDNVKALETVLNNDVDLVIHTAGPFQQTDKCTVLEAAISTQTAYLDVCDDTSYAFRAKSLHQNAVDANIPAIITGGISPGVTNVMAAELVRVARNENMEPQRLKFLYYTAGSGDAGPTVLGSTFLLLGEQVIAYNQGRKVKLRPYTGKLNIDFGKGIGKKDVYLLNLPEVTSTHEVLGIPSVSARFGSEPFFWNWGMETVTNFLPAEVLRHKGEVKKFVQIFYPLVRVVDGIVGESVSMRVDLECSNGCNTIGLFSHKSLSESAGMSTAAFALGILEGSTEPGVWFPEEPQGIAVEARELLLKRATQGTFNFLMNKPPWMVEMV